MRVGGWGMEGCRLGENRWKFQLNLEKRVFFIYMDFVGVVWVRDKCCMCRIRITLELKHVFMKKVGVSIQSQVTVV